MDGILDGLVQQESGQGLAEYALILALVAMVIVGSLVLFSNGLNQAYSQIQF